VTIEIKILSTTAMKTVFEALAPDLARATGHRLAVTLGPSLRLEKQLAEGEAADLAIVSEAGANELVAGGRMVAGSIVAIAKSSIGVAVPKGAPRPDIASVDAFRRAMLAAKSIACSKPVGGGQSGVHIAKVFAQLGIADAMQAKAKYGAGGAGGLAGLVVLRGEADLGIQQMAELMAVPGIDVIGPLPDELQMVTPFVAATPSNAAHPAAGRAVAEFLTTPAARAVIKTMGLEPREQK
jgi:molybdate transport system substrate-binding protein